MPTAVRSHAKINLGLSIGPPRPDGFHALATVYQTLEMYDIVTVTARRAPATAIRLTSNDTRVPRDHRNTAWKMVDLALTHLSLAAEVEIHIEKRLPVQGGLGAGSANAVAALIGLETELNLSNEVGAPPMRDETAHGWESTDPTLLPASISTWSAQRLEIAAQVGSDVPLFLIGGTVLGLDRGQEVYPLPDLDPVWCAVALPTLGVSTPQAFRDWDQLCLREGLTAEAGEVKLKQLSRAYASAFSGAIPEVEQGGGSSGVLLSEEDLAGPQESALVRTGITSWIQNDFERVVFPQHPSLSEIKRILLGDGTSERVLYASLSGSGSALFGLYKSRGDAEAAMHRLSQLEGVEVRITRTLPRRQYWQEMLCQ